ncbi:hypothetical protein ACFPRL_03675 [Pseudoclavibacter helvolus]
MNTVQWFRGKDPSPGSRGPAGNERPAPALEVSEGRTEARSVGWSRELRDLDDHSDPTP